MKTRLALLVLSATVLAPVGAPRAAPSSPFTGAAQFDSTSPEGIGPSGEYGVADQMGAATFAYPIEVPPGRKGMQPALTLRYASTAPLRGGLAAGWSLDLPRIERDPTAGVGLVRYRAQLGGEMVRLIEVSDVASFGGVTYRAELDRSFARFEKTSTGWVVRTPDGLTQNFASSSTSSDNFLRWNVTSQVDPFGNTISYTWERVASSYAGFPYVDFTLLRIEYSSNIGAALGPHAKVEFVYSPLETCPGSTVPIGASVDRHFFRKNAYGARRLTAIRTTVRDMPTSIWRLVRVYSLGYDTEALSCSLLRAAPLRYLTEIGVVAYPPYTDPVAPLVPGFGTKMPAARFTYGLRQRILSQSKPLGDLGFADYGNYRGARGTLMDMDGDGVSDFVRAALVGDACKLLWRRGQYGGGIEASERAVTLPTGRWRNRLSPGVGETCMLNGQTLLTSYYLQGNYGRCVRHAKSVVNYHFVDFNHDGRADLLTSIWASNVYEPQTDPAFLGPLPAGAIALDNSTTGNCPAGTTLDYIDSGVSHCLCPEGTIPDASGQSCIPYGSSGDTSNPQPPELDHCDAPDPRQPEQYGFGFDYVWRVYLNEGGGFARSPLRVRSPKFLSESSSEESFSSSTVPSTTLQTLIDMDGDGFLDVVGVPGSILGSTYGLTVYRGHGGETFDAPSATGWPIPTLFATYRGGSGVAVASNGVEYKLDATAASLRDLNGDGLPDLVVQLLSDGRLYAFWNTGDRFAGAQDLGVWGPLEQTQTDVTATNNLSTLLEGNRGFRRRLLDVDGDGLPDIVDFPTELGDVVARGGEEPTVYFNAGYGFLPARSLPPAWNAAKRIFRAVDNAQWSVRSDFVDMNGDGLGDLVTWTSPSTGSASVSMLTDDAQSAPPHLLTHVDNGRGMTLAFTYGVSADPEVVTQGNAEKLADPRWVVRFIRVTPGANQPAVTTGYHYDQPVMGSSTGREDEPPGFLGFQRVTTYLSSGARSVRDYRYETPVLQGELVDGRGQLVRETVLDTQGGVERVARITVHFWETLPLFGNRSLFPYAAQSLEQTCTASGDCSTHEKRSTTRYQAWPSAASPTLYLRVSDEEGSGREPGVLDRRKTTTYQVRYDAGLDYRVLAKTKERWQAFFPFGVFMWWPTGREDNVLDQVTGMPLRTDEWRNLVGPVDSTLRTFEVATGQLLSITKPQQTAGSGKKTQLAYDTNKVFPTTSWNELGHVTTTTHDVGTGAVVKKVRPNYKAFDCGWNTCARWAYDTEAWSIDGFGRSLSHAVSVDDPASGYVLKDIEAAQYFDSELPTRIRALRLKDFGGAAWIANDRTYDGLGKLRSIRDASGATTTYVYDATGALAAIQTPDPRTDSGAVVTYSYVRDAEGRVTRFARPDGSALEIVYDGLVETRREVTNGGLGGTVRFSRDVLGRLVEVAEEDNPSFGQTARAQYAYDSHDNLTSVRDLDNNLASYTYDWLGNRLEVRRGGRTWAFVYDANGNRIQTTSPVPAGADPTLYTTRYAYDDLDRVTRETPASRGLSATRMAELGIGPITYRYDSSQFTGDPNGIGRLDRVDLPWGYVDYSYDARGLLAKETRSMRVSHLMSVQAIQSVTREYNALGLPTIVTYDDGQKSQTTYDTRGLVESVKWYDPASLAWKNVAQYSRSLAGAPRSRSSDFNQRRYWSFDTLGRPTYESLWAGSTQLARRGYYYNQSGDLTYVYGATGARSASAGFSYDRTHRVVGATGPEGYTASFAYSAAGNVLRANVSQAASSLTRNVGYQYGALDPQAVDALVGDSGPVVTFEYDLSGNMTRRTTPQGTLAMEWDGHDRMREAVGPGGTEVYYYDHTGARSVAVNPVEGARFWFDESETRFPASGGSPVRYLHLSDESGALARVENRTQIELQYSDALHNLMASVDAVGAVVASFLYGPFGEVLWQTGEATHRRQFNGKENDAATGLRYYGARYYDPLTLRWSGADPLYLGAPERGLSDPQRMNLYAFSKNNPVRYYDPDGREGIDFLKSHLHGSGGIRLGGGKLDAPFGGKVQTGTQVGAVQVQVVLFQQTFTLGGLPDGTDVRAYIRGPTLRAGLTANTGSVGGEVGFTVVSLGGRASAGPIGVGAEVGLGLKLGFSLGQTTTLKTPLGSVTISIDVMWIIRNMDVEGPEVDFDTTCEKPPLFEGAVPNMVAENPEMVMSRDASQDRTVQPEVTPEDGCLTTMGGVCP